jgi:cobalamin biosynthesis protein CobD/CbiB
VDRGRDTANLDERDIVRATVETVAENLSDGIVAPLFYLALGGPVAMAAYKAANTLDSMWAIATIAIATWVGSPRVPTIGRTGFPHD